MEDMKLISISGEYIPKVWNGYSHMLDKCLSLYNQKEYTKDGIYEELLSGAQKLWVVVRGKEIIYMLTTKINVYENPKRKIGYLISAGGVDKSNTHPLFMFMKDADEWGRLNECDYMLTYIRKGGRRIMKKYGWKFVTSTDHGELMIRDLENDNI